MHGEGEGEGEAAGEGEGEGEAWVEGEGDLSRLHVEDRNVNAREHGSLALNKLKRRPSARPFAAPEVHLYACREMKGDGGR